MSAACESRREALQDAPAGATGGVQPGVSPGAASASGTAQRFASLDACRGLAVVLMILTDQLEGLAATPDWLRHESTTFADSMTIRDLGPAAFLFILGVSLPAVLERRRSRGDSAASIARTLIGRAIVLSLLGLTMANAYAWTMGSGNAPRISPGSWRLGLWDSLVWASWLAVLWHPRGGIAAVWIGRAVRGLGAAGIVSLAWVASSEFGSLEDVQPFSSSILGVIAIAYLIGGLIGLACRMDRATLVAAAASSIAVYLAAAHEWRTSNDPRWLTTAMLLGSYPSIVLMGMLAWSVGYSPGRPSEGVERTSQLVGFGAVLMVEAVLMHRLEGLNRLAATPAWALGCAGVTCWILAFFHHVLDLRPSSRKPWLLMAAGRNALAAYVLPWFFWSLANALGLPRLSQLVGEAFVPGLAACLVYTVVVVVLAAALPRVGLAIRA